VVRGTWGAAGGLYRFDAGVIDGVGVHGARNATVTGSQLSGFFDKYVVDGLVNLVGIVLSLFSRGFRRVQTGYVGNYALVLATGLLVLVCAYALLRW
jgi:NADH:ubiquinone oxidoreductase subunit 5 (subunit L)/multisubunit Na+/H+ antiporter MnhA subunit